MEPPIRLSIRRQKELYLTNPPLSQWMKAPKDIGSGKAAKEMIGRAPEHIRVVRRAAGRRDIRLYDDSGHA